MNNKSITLCSIILGIVLIAIAIIYWTVPAGSLPTFMPGYIASDTHLHFKHGLLALILGLLSFVLAWFKSGK